MVFHLIHAAAVRDIERRFVTLAAVRT
ncbi:TPA: hypothetical protein N0F65_011800 [Lagenidium giganteum]|uniref:Uncharacterized protein n=1 Tax=Lagenidium giganteum TaxID=4803 RepID=A0AAV2YT31_9STRA|nr:TPA: hypothetical protein N0F65_011800 [Lagenidium giganteum]